MNPFLCISFANPFICSSTVYCLRFKIIPANDSASGRIAAAKSVV